MLVAVAVTVTGLARLLRLLIVSSPDVDGTEADMSSDDASLAVKLARCCVEMINLAWQERWQLLTGRRVDGWLTGGELSEVLTESCMAAPEKQSARVDLADERTFNARSLPSSRLIE